MTREEAVRQIEEALASETSAITLSNRLFTPDGLFHWLADTFDERKVLVTSPLFASAQARLRQLQYEEAAAFGRNLRQAGFASGDSASSERAPSA